MTTRWADGFEDNAVAGLGADYSVAGTWLINTGRRVGTSAAGFVTQTTTVTLTRLIGGTESTMFQSVAVKPATLAIGTARSFLRFLEGATVHLSVHLNAAGAFAVYRGEMTTLLGTSSAYVTGGNWAWFQIKVRIHDTLGTVEIRDASGVVLLNLSGIDTRNAGTGYCDTVSLGQVNNGGLSHDYDDWHVWDTTGAICNDFTNDTRVDHKLPDGAGNSAQFTPSAGANYACVDEANFNTTDYVESSTAGHKDSYAFADIGHSPPSVFAVLRTAVALKDDAGARSLKLLTRAGGTDYAGTAVTLNQGSYSRLIDVQETDPSTSAAWTQAGVNAAEFGFENV